MLAVRAAAAAFRGLPFDRMGETDWQTNADTGLNAQTLPVAPGQCDAFITHSWLDSGEAKWKALVGWRDTWRQAQQRAAQQPKQQPQQEAQQQAQQTQAHEQAQQQAQQTQAPEQAQQERQPIIWLDVRGYRSSAPPLRPTFVAP